MQFARLAVERERTEANHACEDRAFLHGLPWMEAKCNTRAALQPASIQRLTVSARFQPNVRRVPLS